MEDDYDRATLWAAMYDQDDEDDEKPAGKSKPNEVISSVGLRKARRVVMGAVAYEVPTMEYVASLENLVNQQDRIIKDQMNRLRRLETLLTSIQGTLRKNHSTIMDVRSSLDNKIDRRDLS